MNYLDAHNHLHDARLAPHRAAIFDELRRLGVTNAVVNGTRESDWDAVGALVGTAVPSRPLAGISPRTAEDSGPYLISTPSYGLHPWYVRERSDAWLEDLRARLTAAPRAAVGEIGLDRWVEGHDLAVQAPVFTEQLQLAAELHRPATIHCIRAWGALWETLQAHALPAGFLLHAYGGPAEMVPGFVERGAYFSFSTYFLHERKEPQREVFRHLPLDRLLVETDAPDLRPPDERNPRPLAAPDGSPINHPANIDLAYATLADLRGLPLEELSAVVAQNFARLFGSQHASGVPEISRG